MSDVKKKLVRITTVPLSLDKILDGQLWFMNNHYDVIAVSSEKEYLIQCAKNEGVRYKHIEMTRKITPFKDFISLLKLISFLMKEKPLIIHSHTPKAGIIAMLASKIVNVPIRLHTVGGLPLMEETGLKRKFLECIEKVTYSLSTYVFTNSNGLQNHILQNNYTSKSKIKVIGNGSSNGVDINYFSPTQVTISDQEKLKASLGILEDEFVYVFVGRIVADKGINELVAAFDKISAKIKDIKLLLVGKEEADLDPLKKVTLDIISKNKQILTVGFQKDIRPYLSISNVMVFPSYREGFPNVLLQAGAMGLPVIASDINGCNEIISHGLNGILIPKKSTSAIENAILYIKFDEECFDKLQSNSRIMIINRFERKVICETILDEYKNMEKNCSTKPKKHFVFGGKNGQIDHHFPI
ncbi:glycosyltransferase family 4 protein [Flavobacterium aquatile]|uniref:glycosyltransferase family 4 protein n=1 Tax=Flavobacterium aquatile TaxID=245 RepID=UPI0009E03107|nr:glycosyltransferase family 4 protein [Flavobacterium aquatile]OXA67467.1 glycosyltransferase family 1 protein [Flavobacterium aquatile LMG 4008 = ATCC 11947]GEC79205.1 galacturonosyl transferase [Flavobacterium aquatile]